MAARHHCVVQLMCHMQTHQRSALLAYQLHNHVIPLLRLETPAATLTITCFFLKQGKFPCSKQKSKWDRAIFFYFLVFLFNNGGNHQHIPLKFRFWPLLFQTCSRFVNSVRTTGMNIYQASSKILLLCKNESCSLQQVTLWLFNILLPIIYHHGPSFRD